MVDERIVQRAAHLRDELHQHIYRYYIINTPTVTDGEYDLLYHELLNLETEHPELRTQDSPTQRVSNDLQDDLPKIPHIAPILSLSNAFNAADLVKWEERNVRLMPRGTTFEYVLEPKLDGLTIVITYENGSLKSAATRGNGEIGDDVTANIRTLRTIPLRIPVSKDAPPAPQRLVVRGEILILKEAFAKLNEEQTAKELAIYVNARNTASGSLKQKDARITAQRPLTAFIYDIVDISDAAPTTEWDALEFLQAMGFNIVPFAQHYPTLSALIDELPEWEARRHKLPFETDGIVLKINEVATRRELGVSGKDPRGSTAFKFPAEEATTILHDVTVNIGRTGKVTPTAVLEPVFVSGVTVSSATMHNYEVIHELDVRLGDKIIIKRSGEVIPYVIGPVEAARNGSERVIESPTHCPHCNTGLVKKTAVDLYCPNVRCPERVYRSLEFFVSRGAMDIESMGPQTIKQLIESGKITNEADIFLLTADDLKGLEGFADKKITNTLSAIEASKTRPLNVIIGALGVDGVGSTVSNLLANEFGSMDAIIATSVRTHEALQRFDTVVQPLLAQQNTLLITPEKQRVLDRLAAPLFELAPRYLDALDLDKRLLRFLKPIYETGITHTPSITNIALALTEVCNTARPLLVISGLGGILISGIVAWFADEQHIALINKLREAGVTMAQEQKVALGDSLAGKSFVITGAMSVPREHIEELITSHGGKMSGSVSKKTSYVVVGDSPGSKFDKAQEIGIPILSEADLRTMLA